MNVFKVLKEDMNEFICDINKDKKWNEMKKFLRHERGNRTNKENPTAHRPIPISLHKNQLQIDQRPQHKAEFYSDK